MFKRVLIMLYIAIIAGILLGLAFQLRMNDPFVILQRLNLSQPPTAEVSRLGFDMAYLGVLPVGQAQFAVEVSRQAQGQATYQLAATATVANLFKRFVRVRAHLESHVDALKLHTLFFREELTVFDKTLESKEIVYDQRNHTMELEGQKRQILADTHDPLSAFFYLLKQEFRLNEPLDLNVMSNQKNYRFFVRPAARLERLVNGHKVGVWVLEGDIRRRDDNPLHTSTMTLWLLDGPQKIPLLMRVMTNGGLLVVRLRSIPEGSLNASGSTPKESE